MINLPTFSVPSIDDPSASNIDGEAGAGKRNPDAGMSERDRQAKAARKRDVLAGGGVVCEGCGEMILGRLVSGMEGKVWHPGCFK
jgi:hypothetical protein